MRRSLTVLVSLLALWAWNSGAAPAQTVATLNVATVPIDVGSQVLYAKDMGFFQKHGLDVNIQLIGNGAAILSGLASGALDIGEANVVSLATAHDKGLPFVFIAPAALYSSKAPTTALIVAKSATFRSAKELNGKTIAITGAQNITQIGAMAWLDQNGGDPYSVKFVEIPFAAQAPAIAAGHVDAGVTAEPDLSAATGDGMRVFGDVYTAIAPSFVIGAWATTSTWAKAHPDLVKRFVDAIDEAGAWANAHPADSAKILEKYTKIQATPGMKRVVFPDKPDIAGMQPVIDATAKYKVIKASFPAADLTVH